MGRVSDTWAAVGRSPGANKVISIRHNDQAIPADVLAVIGKDKRPHSDFFFIDAGGNLVGSFTIGGGSRADPAYAQAVANFASGYETSKVGFDEWEKATTTPAKAAALVKIGAAPTAKGKTLLTETATKTDNPEAIRKAAVKGLGKQQGSTSTLTELLTDKSAAVRTAATQELKTLGVREMLPVVSMLDEKEADTRVAAANVLRLVIPNAALTRSADFWKNGKEKDRQTAANKLSEYVLDEIAAQLGGVRATPAAPPKK
jgi:hypothetical protein